MECIASGFYSSVMIDASHDPFEENVASTKRVVDAAHANGHLRRGGIGMLGGVEEDIKVDEKNACLTDPEEAYEFVQQSGCDSLACAIGTSHGAYKFSGGQGLHFDRIRAIQEKIPNVPLVMHGSSSVPQDEVHRINQAGGQLKEGAKGVDPAQYLPAAKLGVCKVNIDTDGRWCGRAYTASSSATSPPNSTCARPARCSWPNTPSSSPAATSTWAARANSAPSREHARDQEVISPHIECSFGSTFHAISVDLRPRILKVCVNTPPPACMGGRLIFCMPHCVLPMPVRVYTHRDSREEIGANKLLLSKSRCFHAPASARAGGTSYFRTGIHPRSNEN